MAPGQESAQSLKKQHQILQGEYAEGLLCVSAHLVANTLKRSVAQKTILAHNSKIKELRYLKPACGWDMEGMDGV